MYTSESIFTECISYEEINCALKKAEGEKRRKQMEEEDYIRGAAVFPFFDTISGWLSRFLKKSGIRISMV